MTDWRATHRISLLDGSSYLTAMLIRQVLWTEWDWTHRPYVGGYYMEGERVRSFSWRDLPLRIESL